MPYAQNLLPRDPFPRGLGELAERAGGFGTWVVDMHWGLSPPFITGQNRPYGTPVVQTFYPRSQAPRLQNLQTGPVVAAGTWPDLLQADASPVFRTPVRRVGEQQLSLPPGAGVAGLAGGYSGTGYGHIPLGVARPPTDMYERSLFARGTAGFGEEPTAGTLPDNVTVLGMNYQVTPEDWQRILADQAGLRRTLYSLYTIYAERAKQIEIYNFTLRNAALLYPDFSMLKAHALRVAFGTPDQQSIAIAEFSALLKVREDLRGRTTPEQVASMPADVRAMYEQFVLSGAPSAPLGYGGGPLIAAIPWLTSGVAWVIGGIVGLGAVLMTVDWWRSGTVDSKRADAAKDGAEAYTRWVQDQAGVVKALTAMATSPQTPEDLRTTAMNALQNISADAANMKRKLDQLNEGYGGWGMIPVVLGAMALIGFFVAMRKWSRGGGGGGGGDDLGYGGQRESRGSSVTVNLGGGLPDVTRMISQG